MRTARLLTVSQDALCGGCVPARRLYLPGGVPAQVLPPPLWTDTCKNNLRKLRLRAVKMRSLASVEQNESKTIVHWLP